MNPQRICPTNSDEIDVIDLWRILVQQKKLIIGITFVCTAAAIVVVFLLPREYRAEVLMLPPLAQNTEKLNILNIIDSVTAFRGSTGHYFFQVKTDELYNDLITNLQSSRLQQRFFDDNALAGVLASKGDSRKNERIFQEGFREKMSVTGLKKGKKNRGFVSITLQGKNSKQLADWLNNFVHFVDKETVAEKNQAFDTKVKRAKDSVQNQIASLRASEKSRRLDRIARLDEAVKVASQLGWVERPENPGFLYQQAKNGRMNMSFSLQEMPLYLRGVKALQAEINALKQRTNDDPFIPELRDMQEYLSFLSSIRQDVDDVHAMRIDQAAFVNGKPVKPKRKLIVVLGFILGFLLSIFIAFSRNILLSTKKEKKVPR